MIRNLFAVSERRAHWRQQAAVASALLLAAGVLQASQIVMYWDRQDPYGDTLTGFDVPAGIEVPDNACGFRLGLPGHPWHGWWQFGRFGVQGNVLEHHGITYASSFTGTPSPGPLEAIGPVHACSSGNFVFQTPLGAYDIVGDAPVHHGAGSFSADLVDPNDLVWLDAAGQSIKLSQPIGKDPKPPKLPPEFIGKAPSILLCPLDESLDQYQCQNPGAHAAPVPRQVALRAQRARAETEPEPVGVIAVAAPPPVSTTDGSPPEAVSCPTTLLVRGSIYRNPDFQPDPATADAYSLDPPTVEYRFLFVPEHVASTRFEIELHAEETVVEHLVPLPLPKPLKPTPAGGVTPGSGQMAVRLPGDDRGGAGSGPGVRQPDPHIVADTGPEGLLQGTVRLQLTNIQAANGTVVQVSSPPMAYRIQCQTDDNGGQDDLPVMTIPIPQPPPQPPGQLTAPATSTTAASCAGGRMHQGQCRCPARHRPVQAAPNAWRCVPVRG